MNPAGAEGTALWDVSESLHLAQTPSILDKPKTKVGQENWGNCIWICSKFISWHSYNHRYRIKRGWEVVASTCLPAFSLFFSHIEVGTR